MSEDVRHFLVLGGSAADRAAVRRSLPGVRLDDADALPRAAAEALDGAVVVHSPPGTDALRLLAGADPLPPCPVVVVADDAGPALRRALLRAGAADCVPAGDAAALRGALEDAVDRFVPARDADAQARTERALQASEERYRRLLDSIDEGFCVIEMLYDGEGRPVDYRFVEANPAFARHTGLTDAVGRRVRELVPDLDESWFAIYGRVAATGEGARFENPSKAMGRWFDVYATPAGPDRVALLFTDVTERKRVERHLQESEARFRTLADNIPQLVWIADEAGRIDWYNRRWFAYTGAPPEDAGAIDWWAFHHPDHVDDVRRKLAQHLERGDAWEDTFPLRRRDGRYRWFLARAIPIRDDDGRVLRWFGTHTDVTAQREAEQALRDADRRKDEFLAMLAHELRNPLAPIRHAVEILRMLGPEEPTLRRATDVVERQATHMARLVDDLLDVSRIGRGQLALRLERCDLAGVVRQTAEDYRANLEAAGLTLALDVPPAPVWIEGDRTRLAQTVGNLLHNASKFTPPGGRVSVRLAVDLPNALVTVEDTGAGIAPDLLPRLFDAFMQADQGLARSQGGLGLGLALVKGITVLHGGGVSARSDGPGRGAAITLRLPLAEPGRDAAAPAPHVAPHRPARVLVVEDNADAAETLRLLLTLHGHEATVAPDGPSAIERARSVAPDVVLCDIGLPGGMDGYDVARALRGGPALLVALSGYGQEEDRRRARDAGFDRHLVKPVQWTDLQRVLEEAPRRG